MKRRVYQPQHEDDPYDLEGGPPKWRWHEPTGYVFYEGWLKAMRHEELTRTDWRILVGLLGHCDWQNRCPCTYSSLGRSLGLARETVSRSMPHLVAARLVLCERKPRGKSYEVTLSPYLCWKGRPWHLARARQDFLARWRLQHGQGRGPSLPPPRRGDEASPGVGENAPGEAPYPPYAPLGLLSSV